MILDNPAPFSRILHVFPTFVPNFCFAFSFQWFKYQVTFNLHNIYYLSSNTRGNNGFLCSTYFSLLSKSLSEFFGLFAFLGVPEVCFYHPAPTLCFCKYIKALLFYSLTTLFKFSLKREFCPHPPKIPFIALTI